MRHSTTSQRRSAAHRVQIIRFAGRMLRQQASLLSVHQSAVRSVCLARPWDIACALTPDCAPASLLSAGGENAGAGDAAGLRDEPAAVHFLTTEKDLWMSWIPEEDVKATLGGFF